VVRELAWPARRAISSTGTPESDMRLTKVCRSSRGDELPSIPAAFTAARNSRRMLPVVHGKEKFYGSIQ
jgi:hypothetical protein